MYHNDSELSIRKKAQAEFYFHQEDEMDDTCFMEDYVEFHDAVSWMI